MEIKDIDIEIIDIIDIFKRLKIKNKDIFVQIRNEILNIKNKTCK